MNTIKATLLDTTKLLSENSKFANTTIKTDKKNKVSVNIASFDVKKFISPIFNLYLRNLPHCICLCASHLYLFVLLKENNSSIKDENNKALIKYDGNFSIPFFE